MNKELLKNKIEEIESQTTGYAVEFAKAYADTSQYLCDAFTEFADSNTSIYYYSIMEYIKDNPDSINDAINEFGWDGCGSDIYKAGQMAEFLEIERELYSEIDNIILLIALYKLKNFEDITEDKIQKAEEIEFEGIDQNSRIDEIDEYIQSITEDQEEE